MLSRPDRISFAPADAPGPILSPVRARRQGVTIDCDLRDGKTWRAPVAVKARDIWELWRLFVVQGALAWAAPPRLWPAIAARWGALDAALHPGRTAKRMTQLEPMVKGQPGLPDARAIERGVLAGQVEERFEYLRAHRPGGWEPAIRIHGITHVEAARAAGRGLLFWGSSFAFNDLIAKIALHRLGLNVFHYTRPVHGLSDTRFGIRVLNPVRTSVECAYLGARVSGEENISGAMQVLKDHLATGGAVSIKTGNRGKRRASAPFFGGRLELASGTITLANRWGAALLPTFTLRRADGSFDFVIGAALDSAAASEEERASDIVHRYAEQIAPLVRDEPLQWRGWRFMIPAAKIPAAKAESTGA